MLSVFVRLFVCVCVCGCLCVVCVFVLLIEICCCCCCWLLCGAARFILVHLISMSRRSDSGRRRTKQNTEALLSRRESGLNHNLLPLICVRLTFLNPWPGDGGFMLPVPLLLLFIVAFEIHHHASPFCVYPRKSSSSCCLSVCLLGVS